MDKAAQNAFLWVGQCPIEVEEDIQSAPTIIRNLLSRWSLRSKRTASGGRLFIRSEKSSVPSIPAVQTSVKPATALSAKEKEPAEILPARASCCDSEPA